MAIDSLEAIQVGIGFTSLHEAFATTTPAVG